MWEKGSAHRYTPRKPRNDVGGKASLMASIEGHRKPMHPLFIAILPVRRVTIHTQADSRAPKPSMIISNLEKPFKGVRHRFADGEAS